MVDRIVFVILDFPELFYTCSGLLFLKTSKGPPDPHVN